MNDILFQAFLVLFVLIIVFLAGVLTGRHVENRDWQRTMRTISKYGKKNDGGGNREK